MPRRPSLLTRLATALAPCLLAACAGAGAQVRPPEAALAPQLTETASAVAPVQVEPPPAIRGGGGRAARRAGRAGRARHAPGADLLRAGGAAGADARGGAPLPPVRHHGVAVRHRAGGLRGAAPVAGGAPRHRDLDLGSPALPRRLAGAAGARRGDHHRRRAHQRVPARLFPSWSDTACPSRWPSTPRPSRGGRHEAVTWGDVRAMLASGLCEIESHSHIHGHMDRLTVETNRREAEVSRSILEARTGVRPEAFRLPLRRQRPPRPGASSRRPATARPSPPGGARSPRRRRASRCRGSGVGRDTTMAAFARLFAAPQGA